MTGLGWLKAGSSPNARTRRARSRAACAPHRSSSAHSPPAPASAERPCAAALQRVQVRNRRRRDVLGALDALHLQQSLVRERRSPRPPARAAVRKHASVRSMESVPELGSDDGCTCTMPPVMITPVRPTTARPTPMGCSALRVVSDVLLYTQYMWIYLTATFPCRVVSQLDLHVPTMTGFVRRRAALSF
jgi:hypothetical protein